MVSKSDDFLTYFEDELASLATLFKDFGETYPKAVTSAKLAPRSSDPHVNLLIESFAFLSARIQSKVDELQYAAPEALLSKIDPSLIELLPAISLVEFELNMATPPTPTGLIIPRGTQLTAQANDGTDCNFVSSYPVNYLPVNLGDLRFEKTQGLFENSRILSSLSFEVSSIGCDLSEVKFDRLRIFIDGDFKHASILREFLFNNTLEIFYVDNNTGQRSYLSKDKVTKVGFSENDSILNDSISSNHSYRLFREYVVFPTKFLFFDINTIQFPSDLSRVRLYFGFKKNFPSWFSLSRTKLKTNVTPVVNSFNKIAEPIVLDDLKSEYTLSPELGDKNKFEIININKVTLSSPGIEGAVELPHIMDSEMSVDGQGLSWSARFEKSFGTHNSVKLKIHGCDPEINDLSSQIALLDVTCHNKALAAKIAPGIQLFANFELPGKCKITRFPTNYVPRIMDADTLWKLASRMDLSAAMFIKDASSSENAKMFKDYIKTHIPIGVDSKALEVDSITDITVKSIVKEIRKDGKFAMAEGLALSVIVNEDHFMESNLYLFCDVLNEMLSNLVSVNSFVLLRMSTLQTPEEWEQWEPSHYGKSII